MSEPAGPPRPPRRVPAVVATGRYVRYAGALGIVVLALITLNTTLSTPNGSRGVSPGKPAPPFAVPLAASNLNGDANIATRGGQGQAGRIPACQISDPRALNICHLYARGPLVLVLFVAAGDGPKVLDEVQAALSGFHGMQGAGVSIRGSRTAARKLAARHSFPIGFDRDGAIADLYRLATSPQITLIYPGGVVAGAPLLRAPAPAALTARLDELYRRSLARGWKPPA